MSRLICFAVFGFIGLSLTGCAPTKIPPTVTGQAHKLGIVSAFGDTIHFARSGITVFGNDASEGDIKGWHIDDLVLAQVTSILGPKYQLVTQSLPANSVSMSGKHAGALLDSEMRTELTAALGSNRSNADLWVVIAANCAQNGNYIGPLPCGISISRQEEMLATPSASATIFAAITVFDGVSLKPIAQSQLLTDGRACFSPPRNDLLRDMVGADCQPALNLGAAYAVDRWEQYSPAQRDVIRRAISVQLPPALAFTLHRLGLI
jgi:hypothetical protein